MNKQTCKEEWIRLISAVYNTHMFPEALGFPDNDHQHLPFPGVRHRPTSAPWHHERLTKKVFQRKFKMISIIVHKIVLPEMIQTAGCCDEEVSQKKKSTGEH